eukprot:TRINITY_DN233_c0_g1_i1.p1 TRINITY_DN233_c0_g1~~TRINITY_DN233_c0_g1_i1.p1  ORF type:complete len:128 (+),score=9.61 TRINITY_DN233_c0_g1_i1:239-622(+)
MARTSLSRVVAAIAAPPWFAVGLANALAPIQASQAQIQASLAQIHAKLANAHATRITDALTPLPNAAGVLPAAAGIVFPATRGTLDNFTLAECGALLGHYGVPAVGYVANQRNIIRLYCNIPEPAFS